MSHSIKGAQLLFFAAIVIFAAPVIDGLETNETVTDDFDTGTANFWQWLPGDVGEDSTTFWHLSMHGDAPPFGIDAVRPPMEENGGGYLEIVPFSDSPAQIISNEFDLLPGATVEMTYWNMVPFPITERNTVLNVYIEFLNVTQPDDSTEPPLRTVQVFKAPFPTDQSPGWTTVNIDLSITEPSKVQLRIDGIRRNLTTTGLAVSKVTINNGLDVTTTTTTSTTMTSTTRPTTRTDGTNTPTPTKYAVDKTTSTTSTTTTTTTTTNAPTTNEPPTSDPVYPTDEGSTVSESATELIPSRSSSSSTSTSSPITSPPDWPSPPVFTASSTIMNPQTTISSSSSSVIASTTPTTPTPTVSSTSATVSTSSTTAGPTVTTRSTTSTTTTSTVTSTFTSTETPLPTTEGPGMSTNQLRDVLIGVGVSIFLFFLFCLLFTLCYRRHRRRAYLIENRQLETGIIRVLEPSDHIPYSIHKDESDNSSMSSTTASNHPLSPNPLVQLSIRDLLPNFLRSRSKNSSKITQLM